MKPGNMPSVFDESTVREQSSDEEESTGFVHVAAASEFGQLRCYAREH